MRALAGALMACCATLSAAGEVDAGPVRELRLKVERDPDAYPARLELAEALEAAGRREEALAEYGEAIALSREARPRLARARLLARMSRFAEAFDDLERVTARYPEDVRGWVALGDMRLWNGQPEPALRAYERALRIDRSDPAARVGRARACAHARKYAEAVADLERLTADRPDDPEGWRALGDVRFWMGAPGQAEQAYTRLVSLAPGDLEAQEALSRARRARIDAEVAAVSKAQEFRQIERGIDAPTAPAFPWEIRAGAALTEFRETHEDRPERSDWIEYRASVRRSWGPGSLALEAIRTRRFDLWDDAFAIDGYVPLWSRAYANLRFQWAPDPDVLPESDMLVEPFQGFGDGWEASVFYRHMDFPEEKVDLYGGSLAKYLGRWYFRDRLTLTPAMGSTQASNAVAVRRYYGDAGSHVEIEGGAGETLVTLGPAGPDQVVEHRTSRFATIKVWQNLVPRVGVILTLSYQDDEEAPIGRGAALEVVTRW